MKIPSTNKIIGVISDVAKKLPEATQEMTSSKAIQTSYLDCLDSIRRSQIKQKNNSLDILEQLLNENAIHIKRKYKDANGTMRIKAGKAIQGFQGLYDDSFSICQYFHKNGEIDEIYTKSLETGAIKVYNSQKELLHEFDSSDIMSLHEYKYHPDQIHSLLRYPKVAYDNNSFYNDARNAIENLKKLFNDESKIYRTKEKITVYRGLDKPLDKLKIKDGIYIDNSFCSTTTNLDIAKNFAMHNPIMEIELPIGTKYLDMDRLFNIDRAHWHEQEFLLENGSQFEILNVDKINNYLKVRLI